MLVRNGRAWVIYSSHSTDYKYCRACSPPTRTKSPEPVLNNDPQAGQWGPGHNSFTTTPDVEIDILVYCSLNYKYDGKDPLNTADRATRAQVVRWRPDGTPDFGAPVPDGAYRPDPASPPAFFTAPSASRRGQSSFGTSKLTGQTGRRVVRVRRRAHHQP